MSVHTRSGAAADAERRLARRRTTVNRLFVAVCLTATAFSCVVLTVLLVAIALQGWKHLDVQFLTNYASRFPDKSGVKAALWGSVWICSICALLALPIGLGTAIFMEEYKPRGRFLRRAHSVVQLNISNLAGVPSVVYGIIGLTAFARMFGLFGSPNISTYEPMERIELRSAEMVQGELVSETGEALTLRNPVRGEFSVSMSDVDERKTVYVRVHEFELKDGRSVTGRLLASAPTVVRVAESSGVETEFAPADVSSWKTVNMVQAGSPDSAFYFHLPLGPSVLAAGMTLMLVVLPIVIISSREALRSVPDSLREGALAAGATRWQMIHRLVLPASAPGFMTGAILAMSRAIGEAAPLLIVSGVVFIMSTPKNVMSNFTALPLQIYSWAGQPKEEFHRVAASGIIVLLGALLVFNALAVVIRQKFQKSLQ